MDRIFRLLLVDDEPHVTGALSLQLEAREDLDVYVSNSAAGALDVLRRTRIDLMVSDIRMPGMTGLELLNRAQDLDEEGLRQAKMTYLPTDFLRKYQVSFK